MSHKNIGPCGVWDGDFSWDGYFMRMHVKTVTPTYDMYNPSTWPLVRQVVATENKFDYRKSKVPPEYLVYEQTLIEDLDVLRPLQGQRTVNRRKNRDVKDLFRYYPLNYDRNGELRAHPHLPADELEEWVSQVNHGIRITTEGVDTKDIADHGHPTEVQSDDSCPDACPDTAYEEIMKTLVDSGSSSVAAVARLEKELSCTRKNFQESQKNLFTRCNKLVAKVERIRKLALRYRDQAEIERKEKTSAKEALSEETAKVTKLENELRSLGVSKLKLQSRFNSLNQEHLQSLQDRKTEVASNSEKIQALESSVMKLTADLAVATQETAAGKQRIVKIWKEMKKVQESSLQKNKAMEDISEAQRKKLKSEA